MSSRGHRGGAGSGGGGRSSGASSSSSSGFVNYDRKSSNKKRGNEGDGSGESKRRRVVDGDAAAGDDDNDDKELDYDDDLLENDVFSAKGKRGKKGLRQFEDDSDDEKDKNGRGGEGEDDVDEDGIKKKPKRLNRESIEGEEQGDEADFDNDESGTGFMPFNMNEELEEGDFDETGFYTLKKDAKESHDPWLDSVSREDIKKAKAAKEKYDSIQSEKELDRSTVSVQTCLALVAETLQPKETAILALKRLGGSSSKTHATKRKAGEPAIPSPAVKNPEDKAQFDALTEACDRLVGMGEYGIYSETREAVVTRLGMSGFDVSGFESSDDGMVTSSSITISTPASAAPASAAASAPQLADATYWQYKWQADGEVYGPYSSEQMEDWKGQSLFGDAGVSVRKLNADGSPASADFNNSKRVDFSLYID